MAISGPFISWAVFLTVLGAAYFFNKRAKAQAATAAARKHAPLAEKPKSVFLGKVDSGTDGDSKKKSKKKSRKSALSNTATKGVVSTGSDDDVAEEIDLRDVARRLKPTEGAKPKGRQSPYAASQTSSTGADGDIDEEEADYKTLKGSSTDPRDMLETPTGGPGVLKITPSTQLPRGQKKKKEPSPEPGVHASKNAKKKEKKKAERDAERADQQSRFESHRKAMRAEEAAQQKLKPVQAQEPASTAWTTVGSKKSSSNVPTLNAPTETETSTDLLDTFHADSDNEKQQNLTLGDSWESIPSGVMVPEQEWNEVKKKGRATKKSEEPEAPKPAPEPVKAKPVAPKAPEIVKTKSQRKPQTSAPATSGSDWAEVDDPSNWTVHPESSDY